LTGILLVAFDFGLYAYAFLAVQNGARAAALRNSGGPESAVYHAGACAVVLEELRGLPNIGPAFQSTCGAGPVVVSSRLCSASSPCAGGPAAADGNPATVVAVTYTLPPLFRFPLVGPTTITRTSQMRVRYLP
jgi:hypothetical protein